ncbi:hypothetical protein DFR70_1336 [Nocardia tenerifensis]|uniref:Uncharacterized protein n=1 Tax=Nocardia tenerifensis TaxID=228006 RepID=A0A318K9Q6_9NOCA|nr:hypothetical protein [Nocardia tenerifensis]PXX52274.1 hypothetical protein DFR70_1336 [Nocardia tenerifensis]
MTSFLMSDEPKVIRSAFGKTDEPGTTVAGLVISQQMAQQLDPKTGKPKLHQGRPIPQLEVVILTEWRTEPDDDGARKLYVRGNLRKAIKAAVIAADDTDLRNGARLTVTFTGLGPAFSADYAAPKLYKARYEPPTEASLAELAAYLDADEE